jgi:hypothetical protein
MKPATNELRGKKSMTDPARTPRPNPGNPLEEDSQVQRKSHPGDGPAARPRQASAPDLTPHERLERKLRLGQKLLSELPASNVHARLLSVAVMRRDEALLDGVLAALGQSAI